MEQVAKRIQKFADIETDKICYWKQGATGEWMIYFPRAGAGSLTLHTITEHEDGTITVTPSILTTGHDKGNKTTIHGYLTKGIWKDC